jgi:TolB-like protein/Tfp pilus assembly protein PilF
LSLFNELKRRNVLRVGAAYVVVAWLLIQVVETIFPLFDFDDGPARIVVIVLAIGFVPALVFAWAFELTPEGLKKEKDVNRNQSITPHTGKKLDRMIMVVLVLALGYFAVDKFVLSPQREAVLEQQKVEEVAAARQEGRSQALVDSYGDQSIAVLPFVNMSSDEEQEYFSDGISEELLNLLAKIPELRVISRTSAFSFKGKDIPIPEVARQLNVAHVLEGSVRKSGYQVRITAQLIDARSDTHLWSETYDRDLNDIFAVQDEIAAAVVEKLKVTLMGSLLKSVQIDPDAYALRLQAHHLGITSNKPENLKKAISLYERALAIEPDYAQAWLGISTIYFALGGIREMPRDEANSLAYEAIRKALEIEPNSAEGLDEMAWVFFKHRGDYKNAAGYFERALQSNPTNTSTIGNIAIFLTALGRLEEAVRFAEYQVSRNPTYSTAFNTLGLRYRFSGQPEKAIEALQTALTLDQAHFGVNYEIGAAQLQLGDYVAARAAFEKEPSKVFRSIGLAMTHHALGSPTESDNLMSDLTTGYGDRIPYYIAQILAFRGDADQAFEWLEKARSMDDYELGNVINEPLFENLHAEPTWLPFLLTIGRSESQLAQIDFQVSLP